MTRAPGEVTGRHRATAHLVGGFVALVALLVGAGLVLVHLVLDGPIGRADERASRWLAAHRTGVLNDLTQHATTLANTEGIVLVAAVVVLVCVAHRRLADAAMPVLALVIELAAFLSTTFVVGRPRPDVVRLNSTPVTDSYPSGHTAATFALYGAIALLATRAPSRRAWRVPAFVLVVALDAFVGFARVYRGMHHATDVVAGALLGALALGLAVHVVRLAHAAAPADEPSPGAHLGERSPAMERIAP